VSFYSKISSIKFKLDTDDSDVVGGGVAETLLVKPETLAPDEGAVRENGRSYNIGGSLRRRRSQIKIDEFLLFTAS